MSPHRRAALVAAIVGALLALVEFAGRWYAPRPLPGPPVAVSPWIRDGGLARRDR